MCVSLLKNKGHIKSPKEASVFIVVISSMQHNFLTHYKLLLPKRDQKLESKIM